MITYVPVTDPVLARELCQVGVLLWSDGRDGYEVAAKSWLHHTEFPIWRDKKMSDPIFYIRLEE